MIEPLPVLLVCLAIIVVLAILIYVSGRGQISALSAAYEVRLALQQILANTQMSSIIWKRSFLKICRHRVA